MAFRSFCIVSTALLLAGCISVRTEGNEEWTNIVSDDRTLIVLSAPSLYDEYYDGVREGIYQFLVQYVETVRGHDNIVVLADPYTVQVLTKRIPDDVLLQTRVDDIWIRDFATTIPSKQIQFRYAPTYFDDPQEPRTIQKSFDAFARDLSLDYTQSPLILDGGNIVDNDHDAAIVTTRFMEDNDLSQSDAQLKLRDAFGLEHIAIIPYDDKIMGHSDGMVMFADRNTVIVNAYDDPLGTAVVSQLRSSLPGKEIIEIESDPYQSQWGEFSSACGVHVNAAVTQNHIYLPTFGHTLDDASIELIASATDKEVHPINAQNVCFMGGSVRCLSWQVRGGNAQKIIEAARVH